MSTQARRSYLSGGWFGIFGDNAMVLLPPSEKARVASLWALVDDGAGFDEVLDALLSQGLRDLPGFVLVSEAEHGTKVVLRGPAMAWFEADGEAVEVVGSTDTTWVERSLSGVTGMKVQVEAADDEEEPLTVGCGLVRLSRVEQPPPASPEAGKQAPAEAHTADPLLDAAVQEASPEGSSTDTPDDVHETDVDLAVWHPSAEPPADPQQPGAPPPPVVRAPAVPVARLLFSHGEVVEVDRMVLVGRAPEARRYTLTEEPTLVHVPSPNQEISATHLEVRPGTGPDHGTAMVTDLGSTNGTVLVMPGEHPEDLHPGIPVALVPGAVIDLGDGVTIQVEPA